MKNLTEQQRLIITIVIAVLSMGGLSYWAWGTTEEQRIVEEQVKSVANKLKTTENSVNSIPKLRSEIKGLQSKIEVAERTLPSGKEVEKMLKQIQVLLVQAGLKLDSLTPSVSKTAVRRRPGVKSAVSSRGYYNKHQFKLDLSGRYHELGKFISGIEHLKRFTSIEELSITGKKDPLKIKMTIVTYEFKK